MVRKLNHFSLTVSNIDEAISFFTTFLGFKEESLRYNVSHQYLRNIIGFPDGILNIAFLSCPGCRLELIQYVQPKGKRINISNNNVGSSHICLEVDNIMELHEDLLKEGIRFISDPVEITDGPNSGAFAVYMKGPDNITVELFQNSGKAG